MASIFFRFLRKHAAAIIYLILLVLSLPAIWYSVRTPFALIDDYSAYLWLHAIGKGDFSGVRSIWFSDIRFRPTFDLYNLVTWFVWGDHFTLHHLTRLVIKLISGLCVLQTIRLWFPLAPKRFYLPAFVFCCLFFFWPNNPEARLAPQETLLVFFLSPLLWGYSLALRKHAGDIGANPYVYGLVLSSFAFLGGSKEPAIAVLAVFLGLFIWQGIRSPRRLLLLVPFLLIFVFNISRILAVQANGGYGAAKTIPEVILTNLKWVNFGVFFTGINPALSAFLILSVLIFVVGSARELLALKSNPPEPLRSRIWFLLCTIAGFTAYFLMMAIAPEHALRYLFPLVFYLCLTAAISAAFLVETFTKKQHLFHLLYILACVYFIWVNYSSFIYQYAVQYYNRKMEAHLLDNITRILDEGKTVYIQLDSEYEINIRNYVQKFLPFYRGSSYPNFRVAAPGDLYNNDIYFVSQNGFALGGHRLVADYQAVTAAPFLDRVRTFSSLAPLGPTPDLIDTGAASLGIVRWYIYENLISPEDFLNGEQIYSSQQALNVSGDKEKQADVLIDIPFRAGHLYAITLRYTATGPGKARVVVRSNRPGLYDPVLVQDLSPSETIHTVQFAFQFLSGDTPNAQLILYQTTPRSSIQVESYQLFDLGEFPTASP